MILLNLTTMRGVLYDLQRMQAFRIRIASVWRASLWPANDDDFGGRPAA